MGLVLGISWGYHDSAAALVADGRIVAAVAEERLSRVKHDRSYPHLAIEACLRQCGASARDLDLVMHHESAALKLARIHRTVAADRADPARFEEILGDWVATGKVPYGHWTQTRLGVPPDRIGHCLHHASHAAAAFYGSPFERATIVTMDGVGEFETASVWIGEGARLEKLSSQSLPHSLGLLYSAVTSYLGFEVNEGEYKVMGLAPFGEPAYADDLLDRIRLLDDGGFRIESDWFDFLAPEERMFRPAFSDRFGPPRAPEGPMFGDDGAVAPDARRFADMAASLQLVTERLVEHMVLAAVDRTGVSHVCLSGGVALNAVANGKLQRAGRCRLHVHPAPGDDGCALGAALWGHHMVRGGARSAPLAMPFLGPAIADGRLQDLADQYGFPSRPIADDDLADEIAALIAQGAVIGWVQGGCEWGPRALGGRSILADPRSRATADRVNAAVKFRELFRPFAPAVLAEQADRFFELGDRAAQPGAPEAYMLSVAPVRPEAAPLIPAVTHVDGSARVQLVAADVQPRFAALIRAFAARTGVPVLLNTSFNLRGEPIVTSAEDALDTFMRCGLDHLVLGRLLVSKP